MSATTRVYYNKLIRDHIPYIIERKGEKCEVRRINNKEEFQQELLKKVKEEADSLSMSRTKAEFLDEYADLMVVLETIMTELGISGSDILNAREENLTRKGRYEKQNFLIWSDDVDYKSNETPQGIQI